MEFITVEQFKEQSKEVQEVFLKWWKPSIGDIFIFNTDEYDNSDSNIGVLASLKPINITRENKGEYRIPLFTEGQLRKFIEEKTEFQIVKIELVNGKYDIYTEYKAIDSYSDIWLCDELGDDLLQVYWEVACRIAQEEVDG